MHLDICGPSLFMVGVSNKLLSLVGGEDNSSYFCIRWANISSMPLDRFSRGGVWWRRSLGDVGGRSRLLIDDISEEAVERDDQESLDDPNEDVELRWRPRWRRNSVGRCGRDLNLPEFINLSTSSYGSGRPVEHGTKRWKIVCSEMATPVFLFKPII